MTETEKITDAAIKGKPKNEQGKIILRILDHQIKRLLKKEGAENLSGYLAHHFFSAKQLASLHEALESKMKKHGFIDVTNEQNKSTKEMIVQYIYQIEGRSEFKALMKKVAKSYDQKKESKTKPPIAHLLSTSQTKTKPIKDDMKEFQREIINSTAKKKRRD